MKLPSGDPGCWSYEMIGWSQMLRLNSHLTRLNGAYGVPSAPAFGQERHWDITAVCAAKETTSTAPR